MKESFKLISGTANQSLAKEVARCLKLKLTPVTIKRFNDGEIYGRPLESVRGADLFVIQPTSPDVNANLMELLILVDALKRSSPNRITAVIPYFGYARQDRKARAREPISAKLVARMLEMAGVDIVMTFDLHVAQIQGFFDIPSDNLDVVPLYAEYLLKKKFKNIVAVAPDVGAVTRARAVADVLRAPLAIVDKRRPQQGMVQVENVIGSVKGKVAVLIDDIIDSASTITEAARILKKFGAKDIYVIATHGIFSEPAISRLNNAPIKEVIVTNTIELRKASKKIKVLSIAPLLAETIKRQHDGTSMGIVYEQLHKKLDKLRK